MIWFKFDTNSWKTADLTGGDECLQKVTTVYKSKFCGPENIKRT